MRVNNWATLIQAWLPSVCLLCRAPIPGGDWFCGGCAAELPHMGNACDGCALPLPEGAMARCGQCQRRPRRFDAATALFHYAPPLDHLILGLKFGGRLLYARALGEAMAGRLAGLSEPPDLIVPVPLHRTRLRERGYNQAVELARPIAAALGVPMDAAVCRRGRATLAQSSLPAEQRRRNVKGAFEVVRPLKARHVALVDDVMTSGHTLSELALCLKRQGVERVEVWVCARAGK